MAKINQEKTQEIKNVLDVLLLPNVKIVEGKMFGYPGYYLNGNLFACIYEDSITIKLPADLVTQYSNDQDAIEQLVMMGKTMREWIRVTEAEPADYAKYEKILGEAIEYVATLKPKSK